MSTEKDVRAAQSVTCWRSECRNGCYYPIACSERPAICPLCQKPAHDYRCGVTP